MPKRLIYLVCLGFLLGLVGSVQDANAAITVGEDKDAMWVGTSTTNVMPFDWVAGTNSCLVVMVAGEWDPDTTQVSNIKFGTQSLTRAVASPNTGGSNYADLWYLVGPTGNDDDITVTMSTSMVENDVIIEAVILHGVHQTSSLADTAQWASPDSGTASVTIDAVAGGILIDSFEQNKSATPTPASGQLLLFREDGLYGTATAAGAYRLTTANGTTTEGRNVDGTERNVLAVASFAPASIHLSTLIDQWLADDCSAENLWCNRADLDYSGDVNFVDFAIMAANWSKPSIPPLPPGPWTLNVIDNSSSSADGVRLADIDNDGLMDITTGWEQGGITRVYLNPGYEYADDPWPDVIVGSTANVEDAVFVDLDNDGAVDVVSSCEGGTKKMYVHWAPADADYLNSAWQAPQVIPASITPNTLWMFCVPMEVDGLNGIDLIAGSKCDNSPENWNAQVGWFEAPANPRVLGDFVYHKICDATWIMSIITSDMDGDGDLDVVISDRRKYGSDGNGQEGCRWLENPGPRTRPG